MAISREAELMAMIKAFLATLNTHNVDAALAFFTDDAALITNTSSAPLGSEIAIGKQQIRSHLLGIFGLPHREVLELPGVRKCGNVGE